MMKIVINKMQFKNKVIYKDVNLNLNDTGIYFLMGLNASGKTTLFKIIKDYLKYDGYISNNKIISFVRDSCYLYMHLSVLDNIKYFLKTSSFDNFFGFDNDFLNTKLSKCSYGSQKKVYLCIELNLKQDVYLLDEVTNGLDLHSLDKLRNKITLLSKNSLVILSGHQYHFYETLFDYLLCIYQKKIYCIAHQELSQITSKCIKYIKNHSNEIEVFEYEYTDQLKQFLNNNIDKLSYFETVSTLKEIYHELYNSNN